MKYLLLLCLVCGAAAGADLRLGIIGTDTSHVTAFTKVLNDPANPDHIAGARVVAAFKGGSKDIPESFNRVDKFAQELQTSWKVEMVPDIETLCRKVDAVLLESVDGRVHLAQAKIVIAAGKPLFIDKPLAASYQDVREIARLAKAANVPWFTSSALRYSADVEKLKFDDTAGAITWGPGPFEEHHQLDLAWYAIHPIEMLFTILGTGCEEVIRTSGATADEITCRWKNGKIGTVRTLRPYGDYGAVVFRSKSIAQGPPKIAFSYVPLLQEIVKFFQTGKSPVPNEEMLEIYSFMDAALRSKQAGGKPMKVQP